MATNLSKPQDEVLLMRNVLTRLKEGKLSTFSERLRTQKTQYFAQVFKVSPPYSYNLYLRGPYSPSLTKDLFTTKDEPTCTDSFEITDIEERFNHLQKFISDKSEQQLERLATFHWLRTVALMPEQEARQKLAELKKCSAEEIDQISKQLEEVPA